MSTPKLDSLLASGAAHAELVAFYYSTLIKHGVPVEHACEFTKAYLQIISGPKIPPMGAHKKEGTT